ncbi:hypothetical protein [Mycobacteroides abscessus]|uniref:hypothetical protein n=1 Tax=Mycobacteroides abscessus TaxID=36809 RepID=UPI0009AB772F|nr:hypothetical protein [Mycobacteroides abscessus]
MSAFPRHPELDTAVTPFADDPVTAVEGAHALVRVQWATKVTTITPGTSDSETEYVAGGFGSPSGTTWYLTPVTFDASAGVYRIGDGLARGHENAALPSLPAIDGETPPEEVAVHDFRMY